MKERIRKSFREGIARVKWMAGFIAERTRVETSLARLLYQSSKLERRLEELYCDLGKRVFEIRDKDEKAAVKDFIALQTISEIKKVTEEIEDCRSRADEIGTSGE